MAVTGLQHFNLRIPDSELRCVERFYIEVLGLRKGPRPAFRSLGVWLYAGDRPLLHLTQMSSGETVSPGSPTSLPAAVCERFSALDHIAMACDDRAAMEERLRNHRVGYRITEVPETGEVQLLLRDPRGVGIELIFPLQS